MTGPLQVIVEHKGPALVIRMDGDAGLPDIGALEPRLNALVAGSPRLVVLDLRKLGFVSSLAIGLFVSLAQALKSRGGTLRLAAPNPDVELVFARTKLHAVIPVFANVETAVAAPVTP